jgi:hypothetical protein
VVHYYYNATAAGISESISHYKANEDMIIRKWRVSGAKGLQQNSGMWQQSKIPQDNSRNILQLLSRRAMIALYMSEVREIVEKKGGPGNCTK